MIKKPYIYTIRNINNKETDKMYYETKDDTIAAKKVNADKYVSYTWIDGVKVAKVIEGIEDIDNFIGDVLPRVGNIFTKLIEFVKDFTNPFPTIIEKDHLTYRLTTQRAPFEAIDQVFYMCVEDRAIDFLYHFQHKKMGKAKQALKKALKEDGII